MEKEFAHLQAKRYELEKQALLLETAVGAGALAGWNALTNFAVPNTAISAGKHTELGQRWQTSFFEAGIEHGQNGLTLTPSFQQGITYLINKDAFKDYQYGKEIGKILGHKKDPRKDKRLKMIYEDMMNRFGDTPEKLKELRFTPLLGTFHRYMNKDRSPMISNFLQKVSVKDEMSQEKSSSKTRLQNVEKYVTRGALETAGIVADPLSIVTRPVASVAHERATTNAPTDANIAEKAIGSFFLSPRVYDKQELQTFLERHTDKKRVIKQYMNFPNMIEKQKK
jgi:hypothetical protein